MNSDTLYEHPLNEQVRVYLRLEYLLEQVSQSSSFNDEGQWRIFFRSLFELIEILEQVQVKGDLIKDLEKQRKKLEAWMDVPQVDTEQLRSLLLESRQLQQALLQAPRLGQALREDKFLAAIRQRFSIPGGTCSFDLPILHHWLNLPLAHRQSNAAQWRFTLKPLENALQFWLTLTRGSAVMQPFQVANGFYQQDIDSACLLRLGVSPEYHSFPLISGHKSRVAIRFMPFEEGHAVPESMSLTLAVC